LHWRKQLASTENHPQVVKLGTHEIPTRIVAKRIRWVKERIGVDLSENGVIVEFLTDTLMMLDVCYELYRDHFENKKIDKEMFEDLCGSEEVASLRAEVDRQMRGFSNLWKIVSTEMEGALSGNTDRLLEIASKLPPEALTGPSSLPPLKPSGSA
jgi:hypothetical protein